MGQAALATTWMVALGGQSAAEAATSWTYNSPEVTFAVVVVAASTCAVLALAVTARGYRTRLAETALLGSFLLGASVLPLAHGLLTEGVLYGPNTAVTMTMLLAVPVSSVAVIPVLAPNAVWSHALLAHWRMFVPMHVGLVFALASASLLWPSAPPEVIPGSMSSWLIVAAAVAICALVSLRHLGLAVISGRYAPLSVAVGFAMIGSAPLSLVSGQEGGAGFWFAHVLDAGGVFVAGAAIYVVYRRSASMHAVLEPIDAVTPLRALEIGLDPLVHRFVADLETKDRITRDHVVRTARLGVLVATELGLASTDVRTVGVGAILHDVGKLDAPMAY